MKPNQPITPYYPTSNDFFKISFAYSPPFPFRYFIIAHVFDETGYTWTLVPLHFFFLKKKEKQKKKKKTTCSPHVSPFSSLKWIHFYLVKSLMKTNTLGTT